MKCLTQPHTCSRQQSIRRRHADWRNWFTLALSTVSIACLVAGCSSSSETKPSQSPATAAPGSDQTSSQGVPSDNSPPTHQAAADANQPASVTSPSLNENDVSIASSTPTTPSEPFTSLVHLGSLEADPLSVKAIAFAPDNQAFVTGGSTPKIWKLGSAEPSHVFDELYPIGGTVIECDALAISPDGSTLALGSSDGNLTLIDMSTTAEQRRLPLHSSGIVSVRFSADGKRILTSGYDGTAKLIAAGTGEVLSDIHVDAEKAIHSALTPDGTTAVSVGQDALVWDIGSGKQQGTLNLGEPRAMRVMAVDISGDGKLIATGEATVDYEPAALIWSTTSHKLLATLKHELGIMTLAFSPDSKLLVTAGMEPKANIWRIADRQLVQTIDHPDANSIDALAWSPDGKLLHNRR